MAVRESTDMNRKTALIDLYRTMRLIRTVETALARLFADSEVPGFIHLSIGQEALAAGIVPALSAQDTFTITHRGHGYAVARGIDLGALFKEIMGKDGGVCAGRGGSMHLADMDLGILGANGIVGGGIPIALGSALAHSVQKSGGLAVAFFGDGALGEGVFYESLNLAAVWRLPMLFVCENNGWSEFSRNEDVYVGNVGHLAQSFGLPYAKVDGSDVEDVAKAAKQMVLAVRAGDGPRVLECLTHRIRGHFEGDPQDYRAEADLDTSKSADPLALAEQALLSLGATADELAAVTAECEARVALAISAARADREPDIARACADVYTAVEQPMAGAHHDV